MHEYQTWKLKSNSDSSTHAKLRRPVWTTGHFIFLVRFLRTRRKIHRLILRNTIRSGFASAHNCRRMLQSGVQQTFWVRGYDGWSINRSWFGIAVDHPLHFCVYLPHRDYDWCGRRLTFFGYCWGVSTMNPYARRLFVLVEVWFQGEGFAASSTNVGFRVGMCLDMGT